VSTVLGDCLLDISAWVSVGDRLRQGNLWRVKFLILFMGQ
jgi:hypothetical protein